MKDKHARFSPSGAHQWFHCSTSLLYKEMFPPDAKKIAVMNKGTNLHEAAEAILLEKEFEGDISEESFYQVKEYTNYLLKMRQRFSATMLIEQGVEISEDIYGTADAVLVSQDFIQVVDLKTGRVPVSPKGNLQLAVYLLGAMLSFPGRKKFYATIFQINESGTNCETVEFPHGKLLTLKECLLSEVEDIKKGHYTLRVGEWCKYCPGKETCPALWKAKQ